MLRKLGLPLLALGAMLGIGAAKPANAQVQFGVQAGPAYPYCSVYDPYCTSYAYDPYAYTAPAPYVYGGGWGGDTAVTIGTAGIAVASRPVAVMNSTAVGARSAAAAMAADAVNGAFGIFRRDGLA